MEIPHVGFIITAYGITAAAIAAMIAFVWLDYRRLSAELEALEARRREKEGGAT
ncbi:MAG: heme exporter protein CcmD [Roseiarcus sp.]